MVQCGMRYEMLTAGFAFTLEELVVVGSPTRTNRAVCDQGRCIMVVAFGVTAIVVLRVHASAQRRRISDGMCYVT